MKKFIKGLFENISDFFTGIAVLVDEDRRANLDGAWDKYYARKNRRAKK